MILYILTFFCVFPHFQNHGQYLQTSVARGLTVTRLYLDYIQYVAFDTNMIVTH